MRVYGDITFCPFYQGCKDGKGCRRALTVAVEAGAKRAEEPIFEYTDKPECFKVKG